MSPAESKFEHQLTDSATVQSERYHGNSTAIRSEQMDNLLYKIDEIQSQNTSSNSKKLIRKKLELRSPPPRRPLNLLGDSTKPNVG